MSTVRYSVLKKHLMKYWLNSLNNYHINEAVFSVKRILSLFHIGSVFFYLFIIFYYIMYLYKTNLNLYLIKIGLGKYYEYTNRLAGIYAHLLGRRSDARGGDRYSATGYWSYCGY